MTIIEVALRLSLLRGELIAIVDETEDPRIRALLVDVVRILADARVWVT